MDIWKGRAETEKLTSAVDRIERINVIAPEARACIWDELMIHKKGLRNMRDCAGPAKSVYKFKLEYLNEMIVELTRLKTKYSVSE